MTSITTPFDFSRCILYGWRCCRSRFENKIDSGNQVTTEDEDTISKQRLEFLQCNYKYYPTPLDFTLPEYMEKVIMYGYFMVSPFKEDFFSFLFSLLFYTYNIENVLIKTVI